MKRIAEAVATTLYHARQSHSKNVYSIQSGMPRSNKGQRLRASKERRLVSRLSAVRVSSNGGFMRFTYHWLHIKSGKTGTTTTALYEYSSESALLKFLNRCNSQNPGTWQYWY